MLQSPHLSQNSPGKISPGKDALTAQAVVLESPEKIALRGVELTPPTDTDVLVATRWSSISSGTERLLYQGKMPPFPGMGYPLVPGYETVGDVIWAGADSGRSVGDRVFVPGATCFKEVHALFGGACGRLVVSGQRVLPVSSALGADAVLIALAATAQHIWQMSGPPDLIVGHGILGRLMARLSMTHSPDTPPTVWETDSSRLTGARGYPVCQPADDPRKDYKRIVDVSGDSAILDQLIARLARGGEIVLGGFYSEQLAFTFPAAFMREAQIRIAAEFNPADTAVVARLIETGSLDLSGLLTDRTSFEFANDAYAQAFSDRNCLKMVLEWEEN